MRIAACPSPRELDPGHPRARSPCVARGTVVRAGADNSGGSREASSHYSQCTTTRQRTPFREENKTLEGGACDGIAVAKEERWAICSVNK